MLNHEQFSDLLNHIETNHDDGPKPVIRRVVRQACLYPLRITLAGQATRKVEVVAQDISARGICFALPESVRPGTTLLAHLERADGTPFSVAGTVIYCRPVEAGFYVGAEFTAISRQEAATLGCASSN